MFAPKPSLKLGSKIDASEPPRNDLKVVGVIEMIHMYGARGSFNVLRPKDTIKLLTQSAKKWSCMGKWAVSCGSISFLRLQKDPRRSDFFGSSVCYQCVL